MMNKEWVLRLKALPLKELVEALGDVTPSKDHVSKEECEHMKEELIRRYKVLKGR